MNITDGRLGEKKPPNFLGGLNGLLRLSVLLIVDIEDISQTVGLKIHHDLSIDVESWGGLETIGPLAHLPGRPGCGGNVDFGVRHLMIFQPDAGPFAIRAPGSAIHHHPAVRKVRNILFPFRFGRDGFTGDARKLLEKDFIAGLIVDIVDVDIADNAILVDDKDGPFSITLMAQDAVLSGDFAVRPEIAQQGIGDAVERFSPGLQAGHVIDADTQNLGIHPGELGQSGLVRRDLRRSDGSPGQGEEGQDDRLSLKVAERDGFAQLTGQGEIGS